MKIGVSSYSFSRLVNSGRMTQLDVVAKTREMGLDFIEFAGLSVPDGETLETFAPKVREACAAADLPILNYTIGADFINGSGGDWEAEVERLKGELNVAKVLGATGMRHDATRGFPAGHVGAKGFDDALPTLIKGCRAVTEIAADLGIRTMIENHGFFCQDSERVEKLVNGVNHPNFGLLVDIGNFLCADDPSLLAVGRVAPYAFHVHAKDFHVKDASQPDPGRGWFRSRGGAYLRGSIIGHGDVPVQACLGILKRVGYRGALAIEFEGLEDPIDGIAISLENLRRFDAAS
ncbi:MAG: sugar phosphate isomerase/epimerase family protein [Kiritimatiellia bacterium]|jgi:sugar phosphate isomerase/epimerase